MPDIRRTKPEYGGFLPLELNPGKEYFAQYEPYLRRFNSAKAGIDYLIKRIGKKKIFIPYYYCLSTTDAIKRTGIEVSFYHINENMEPEHIEDGADSIILIVDYFGVCKEMINAFSSTIKKADLIIDRAHNFFEEPIRGDNIHNLYSAKKFFGVPDGAYVVSNIVIPDVEALSDSYEYADYLLLTYENGTNVAYGKKKNADKQIGSNYDAMSKLAKGLLENVDYKRVRRQRKDNYRILLEAFKDINNLSLPDEAVPYQFPLLLKGKGRDIKKQLIENRIFVSTLWSGDELQKNGNEFEISMMEDCVFLPMDQRYNEEDMDYIISVVRNIVNENT